MEDYGGDWDWGIGGNEWRCRRCGRRGNKSHILVCCDLFGWCGCGAVTRSLASVQYNLQGSPLDHQGTWRGDFSHKHAITWLNGSSGQDGQIFASRDSIEGDMIDRVMEGALRFAPLGGTQSQPT
jgi:hypothetical protein